MESPIFCKLCRQRKQKPRPTFTLKKESLIMLFKRYKQCLFTSEVLFVYFLQLENIYQNQISKLLSNKIAKLSSSDLDQVFYYLMLINYGKAKTWLWLLVQHTLQQMIIKMQRHDRRSGHHTLTLSLHIDFSCGMNRKFLRYTFL